MTLYVAIQHGFEAFNLDVDFSVPQGVTAIFGRSGSGKTTIVNAVAGLLKPDSARIALSGTVLEDTQQAIRRPAHSRAMGYVFQEGRLFPHLTVARNIDYARRFRRGADLPISKDRLIEILGIGDLMHRMPAKLSGGEKQRVALARALMSAPDVLLLDEPLAALDDERKREVLPCLEGIRDNTTIPIIYVSHSTAEVARLADRVLVIAQGRIVAHGDTNTVFTDPDIWPDMGVREAGSILRGRVAAHADDGLTAIALAGGTIHLPTIAAPVGTGISLRISAHDVIIASEAPSGFSALNVLPATVQSIRAGQGPGAIVSLAVGEDTLLARITRRSADRLGLHPGMACHAIMKSVAVAPLDIGGKPRGG